jgi:hypothetical protein
VRSLVEVVGVEGTSHLLTRIQWAIKDRIGKILRHSIHNYSQ